MDVKKCFIELPCEICILSVGFAVSYLSISDSKNITGAGSFLFVTLLVLIIDYALVKYLFDKLGRFTFPSVLIILAEYLLSIFSYVAAVYIMIEMR